jgi:predicted transcriptional regulator
MAVTSVRLQPEVEKSLEAVASKLHRSKSWLINQAVREYVERQKLEQARWKETLQALEALGQGRVVAGDSVNAWLRSWGSAKELPPPKVPE